MLNVWAYVQLVDLGAAVPPGRARLVPFLTGHNNRSSAVTPLAPNWDSSFFFSSLPSTLGPYWTSVWGPLFKLTALRLHCFATTPLYRSLFLCRRVPLYYLYPNRYMARGGMTRRCLVNTGRASAPWGFVPRADGTITITKSGCQLSVKREAYGCSFSRLRLIVWGHGSLDHASAPSRFLTQRANATATKV